ncbi:MAG: 4Fe-4S binding protein [Christensenellaceae bacterium]
MYAVRNIRLCTKDCLCLYICPTGASDTETGQIDAAKCTGCGACIASCPSHAISMAPEKMPPQQKKTDSVKNSLFSLVKSKAVQEKAALQIAESTSNPVMRQFAEAVAKSNRTMAEDIVREAGYMIPQSANTRALLNKMLENPSNDFPVEAVKTLLDTINFNE